MNPTNINVLNTLEYVAVLSELDKKNIVETTLKCSEEVGELAQAVLSHSGTCGCGYKNLGQDKVMEESADVIIVALSVMFKNGGNLQDFSEIFERKLAKWHKVITEEKNDKLTDEMVNNEFMIHKNCLIAKGIKRFKCINCGKDNYNHANGISICFDCAKERRICRICGEKI